MSNLLLIATISYIIGSIPIGFLVGKVKGVDIREHGSRNIGATNALRVLGPWAYPLVLTGDVLKGVVGVSLGKHFSTSYGEWAVFVTALAALSGHLWSIFLRFKGGKGAATAVGIILTLAPWIGLIALGLHSMILFFFGLSSLGTLLAAVLAIVLVLALPFPAADKALTVVVVGLLFWRHIPNIRRLAKRQELKLNLRGKN